MKVLIVDDDALLRAMYKDIVSRLAGFEVVGEAEDGAEALDKAKELKPDVVLLDIVMPKMNGIEAAYKMSRLEDAPQIIICSSMKGEEVVKDAKATGICAYIKKPPHEAEIIAALKSIKG